MSMTKFTTNKKKRIKKKEWKDAKKKKESIETEYYILKCLENIARTGNT